MLLLLGGGQALASTAANHIIENTVNLSYESTSGSTFTDTTFAQVTVDTIQVAPSVVYKDTYLTVEGDGTDITDLAEDTQYTVIYTLTSNSNGPETYTFEGTNSAETNLDAIAVFGAVGDFSLAASTFADGAQLALDTGTNGATAINIPSDSANDGTLNGFTTGGAQTILILTTTGDDVVCDVVTAGDGTGGVGNAIGFLTVDNCVSDTTGLTGAFTVDQGDPILERREIEIAVTTDSVTATFVFGSHDDINVTTDTVVPSAGGPQTAVDQIFIVYDNNLNIYKYVRNVTDVAQAPTASNPYDILVVSGGALDTLTYYRSGGDNKGGELAAANGLSASITALPLEVLEYAILIVNDGGTASNVLILDDQAVTAFTQIDTATILLMDSGTVAGCASNTCTITETGTTAAPADLALTTANDIGGMNGDVLTIYAGIGGDETDVAGTGPGGTIAIGGASLVVYQVAVD
jgi:hypothetical protein